MNGAEALTRLIALADTVKDFHPESLKPVIDLDVEKEDIETAAAICTAMLNTMLPIARWRLFVTFQDREQPKRSKEQNKRAANEEFTVCSVSIAGLKGALQSLLAIDHVAQVTLWEQRATGAEMMFGYEGPTKRQAFREFISQMEALESRETLQ